MSGSTEHEWEGQPEDEEEGTTAGSLSSTIRQNDASVQSPPSRKLLLGDGYDAKPNRWTQSIFCSAPFVLRKVPMILDSAGRQGMGVVIKEAVIYR